MDNRRVFHLIISMGLSLPILMSCQTIEKPEKKAPPQITEQMTTNELIQAGVEFGGDTIDKVKKTLKRKNKWQEAAGILEASFANGLEKYDNLSLVNAMHLFQHSNSKNSIKIFKQFISSGRPLAKQLAWQLAASQPSARMAVEMDRELTRALVENEEASILMPQMAAAVQANRLGSAYTVVRQGLFSTGNEGFAMAMATLDPLRASNDFLDYLALAPVEELRQMNVSTLDLYTCIFALKHMARFLPSSAHPKLEHIFYFAVSRNSGLSELADNVINEFILHKLGIDMAQMLARLPAWIQIAYVENMVRKKGPNTAYFLSQLKQLTPQEDVVEEIDESLR